MKNFGAQYEYGSLNHSTLTNQRRALILTHTYCEFSREVDSRVDAVLKLTELISDLDLASVVKSCVDILIEQHVRQLFSIK
jgi:hypothetical protein